MADNEERKGIEEEKLDFSRLLTEDYFQKPIPEEEEEQKYAALEEVREPFDEISQEEVLKINE